MLLDYADLALYLGYMFIGGSSVKDDAIQCEVVFHWDELAVHQKSLHLETSGGIYGLDILRGLNQLQ